VSRIRVRHATDCVVEAEREVALRASDVEALAIDAGSGELRVEGREGLDQIVAVGLACASNEEYLDALRLTVERSGGGTTLVSQYPERRSNGTARIDLTVLVPLGLDVSIDDSSGDIEVSGTGDLRIDDSSGSIRASSVLGSLSIDDSSGDIDVRDVTGDVEIEDGSGGLEVVGVGGSLRLRDGSGGIEVEDVTRDVVVEGDGSGSISVRDVGGDFIVDHDGSGGIRHSGVRGRVDIPKKR